MLLGLWVAAYLAYQWSSKSSSLIPNVFKVLENEMQITEYESQESSSTWDGLLAQEPLDAIWQRIAYTKNYFYVFSAFVERRQEEPAIRVIAATKRQSTDEVFCRLWLPGNNTSHVLDAEVKIINGNDKRYPAVFVLCLLKDLDPEATIGGTISIVSQSAADKIPSNFLKIIDTNMTRKNRRELNLHICVQPFHGSINRAAWMVEWLELNRLLGVSHFYFYNQRIGKRLRCFLRKYRESEQLFTNIHFPLPFSKFDDQSQLAAANDCLYRSMSRAEWILVIDIDEVVLPQKLGLFMVEQSQNPKPEPFPVLFELLVNLVGDSQSSKPAAFLFRNAHFYYGYKDDPLSPVPLVTSRKTRRSKINEGGYMKYAVRTSKAIELNTHDIPELVLGNDYSSKHWVSPQFALMHHYRMKCRDEINCTSGMALANSKIDRTAHIWAKQLWKRVDERLSELNQVCP